MEASTQAKPDTGGNGEDGTDFAPLAISRSIPRSGTIPFIEVIRGIAPLFVLWAHLGPVWYLHHPSSCDGPNSWKLLTVSNFITNSLHINDFGGHLGVLLFFLVSGFIISHVAAIETRQEFTVKRVFRIVPMLIAGVTITYAVSSVLVRMG